MRDQCLALRRRSCFHLSSLVAIAALAACSIDDVRFSNPDASIPSAPVTLGIVFAGNAPGTVRSDTGGLDCPGTCTITVDPGTTLTLTATPSANAHLASWSGGGCSGSGATCQLTVRSATSVSATFNLDQHQVTVARAGSGSGTVRSSPSGIDCPGTCTTRVDHGSQITVTATASPGSVFVGWASSIDECTAGAACSLTIRTPVTFTATFALEGALEVLKTGNGAGTVTSNPAGIDCGTDCSQIYPPGQMVTLSAAAAADSTFMGWSGGGCTGTGTCTVTLDAAMMVTASFVRQQRVLTVNKTGAGSGAVTSNPAGIDCGATCSASFDVGSMVALTATPAVGSTFTGWSGGGCTGTGTCTVTLSAATTVTASFAPVFYPVTVTKVGSGTVISAPSGISCGTTCTASYAHGTMVTLTASPAPGFAFTGWSGGCMGTGTCMLTVTAAANVTATFTAQPYVVTVTRAGTGMGTVTSNPAGINCGTDCDETVLGGSTITLTATPAVGSTFAGWTGGGCTGTGTCTLNVIAAANVTATFTLNTYALTVSKGGTGGGTVTSAPAGINCGATCNATFSHGASVTLTAVADVGSTFAGWTGGGCSGTGTCTVSMTAPTGVSATFTRNTYLLTVNKAGAGTGTVSSTPGIDCGADCSEAYPHGTSVTLSAAPAVGSVFSGWSGACTGTGSCTVTMTAAASVTATFARATYLLSVSKAGNDVGTVSSSPAGIDCGPTCSASYVHGDSVTLTATPGSNAVFAGWSGACTGAGTCTVSMTAARSVTATFTTQQHLLTVSRSGAGSMVTSTPAGINCGTDCDELYDVGTMVTLSASASPGWTFSGWSGACTGAGTCMVVMTTARAVTATFTRNSYPLSVGTLGSGAGSVSSAPAGISCPGTCSATYFHGDLVTLFPSPAPGSVFAGWGGACTGTGTCSVSMTAARTVTASFDRASYTLTVSKAGTGSGHVGSSPGGIDCGPQCFAGYWHGDLVTLTATPGPFDVFAGWIGACSGLGTCTVSMTSHQTVTATFNRRQFSLDVGILGDGAGFVSSSPGGISCGSDCSEVYDAGTMVTLTASPQGGATFTGWTGACAGTNPTCTVTMTSALSVGAQFTRTTATLTLTVASAGNFGDTVVVVNGGTICGDNSTCSYEVAVGTAMTLQFVAGRDVIFSSWTGACEGQGATCTLSLTGDMSTLGFAACGPPVCLPELQNARPNATPMTTTKRTRANPQR